jgi:hypothetical protein
MRKPRGYCQSRRTEGGDGGEGVRGKKPPTPRTVYTKPFKRRRRLHDDSEVDALKEQTE